MSCCETQAQADSKDPNLILPSFLKFSRHLTQFDLNTPTEMARGMDADEPTESNSQPNNIL